MRYLFDRSEAIELECDAVIRRHPSLSDGAEVIRARAGETVPPLAPGHYLISETTAPGEERVRYLGVAGRGYTVMQLTVGSFTSDTFDAVVHANRVPVNYYVNLGQVNDSTFRGYEQDYGDAVYPHLMPNSLSPVDPAFACHDANWDSLDAETIETRLRALDGFWRERGFAPLHGIATYTPSNSLVAAMKRLGWRVLHSVVPEQNWSDGRWAINHWGMPNQPFYVSGEDFRKPAERGENNVIAMSMNSYHLYMPHVTHWGDNVLSPSHFLRWHRTVESGPEPLRFGNFLRDYLAAAEGREEPFFLIAGFEFGRTFGVRSMTKHNRRGLELVLEAAKRHPVVFATGRDVALYYERHQLAQPEAVFTQRDYLAGTRIMDKPVNSGPSIGMEMHAYKAVFAHLEPLPFYHYDYLEPWHYRADDTAVPRDYVESDRAAVEVRRSGDVLTLRAAKPLERAVPVAVWAGTGSACWRYGMFRSRRPPNLPDRIIRHGGCSGSGDTVICTSISRPRAPLKSTGRLRRRAGSTRPTGCSAVSRRAKASGLPSTRGGSGIGFTALRRRRSAPAVTRCGSSPPNNGSRNAFSRRRAATCRGTGASLTNGSPRSFPPANTWSWSWTASATMYSGNAAAPDRSIGSCGAGRRRSGRRNSPTAGFRWGTGVRSGCIRARFTLKSPDWRRWRVPTGGLR